jgi:hypothetical protein
MGLWILLEVQEGKKKIYHGLRKSCAFFLKKWRPLLELGNPLWSPEKKCIHIAIFYSNA